jgi:hypothetical protein
MKLRFHGDTLRLRLSQSEVARLGEVGCVEEQVRFAPGRALRYSLESSDTDNVAADFTGDLIRVMIPRATAAHWIRTDETGIQGSGATLKILIEKDFQCIHPGSEDADSFPNPLGKDS